MGTTDQAVACDYVDMEFSNKVENKFQKAEFTATKSKFVDVPIVNELSIEPVDNSHCVLGKEVEMAFSVGSTIK